MTAMRHGQASCIDINNEGGNLFAFLAVYDFRRRLRHHHKHTGFQAIRAPKLFAIENERGAVRRWLGAQTHGRGIGAGVRFGEREG